MTSDGFGTSGNELRDVEQWDQPAPCWPLACEHSPGPRTARQTASCATKPQFRTPERMGQAVIRQQAQGPDELTANGELILAGGSSNGHRSADLGSASNPSGWARVLKVKTPSGTTLGCIPLHRNP